MASPESPSTTTTTTTTTTSLHSLLLLSDSALPLGSFAYSSGLESFLAHHKLTGPQSHDARRLSAFNSFLEQSLHNIASTSLPYVLAAWRSPSQLFDLDQHLDASTLCTVARRASITQGRALIGVWERALSFSSSFSSSSPSSSSSSSSSSSPSTSSPSQTLHKFAYALKSSSSSSSSSSSNTTRTEEEAPPQAHFAPLFGAVCRAQSVSSYEAAYVFLLNHAKAVLSAAVRASILGPYHNQAMLASAQLQKCIAQCIEVNEARSWEDARTEIPTMDLWMGRHELLYSRIFNS